MSIAVNNNTASNNTYASQATTTQNTAQNTDQTTNKNTTVPQDEVTISGQTPESAKSTKKTYGKPANPEAVAKMKEEAQSSYNQLKQLVEGLILKQGTNWADIISGKTKLNADAETIKKAQADIAEDGYYGVEQTAGRILDFAKALIGDDISKLGEMRDGVEKGFAAAAKALGLKSKNDLPDICGQTYTKIMETFDSWEKEGKIS